MQLKIGQLETFCGENSVLAGQELKIAIRYNM